MLILAEEVFNESEKNFVNYLQVRIAIYLFGNVVMHLDDNRLYNNKHRPNINIYLKNNFVLKKVKDMILMQDKEYINDDLLMVKELEKQNHTKVYSKKAYNSFIERINLSKKVLSDK